MTDESLIVKPKITIKVFGIGGGGNSVLARMSKHKAIDMELVAVNTDARQLASVSQEGIRVLQIGETLTHGRGTGGNIALAEQAARAEAEKIRDAMKGADLVFITAGMGGGTGTGAAPIVANVAKDLGVLSVGVVTQPFSFEGNRKKRLADEGIAKMQAQMDALIVVANDSLQKLPENHRMTLVTAFQAADSILLQAISCIAELILETGFINVDFADVTTIFRHSESSDALLGIGRSAKDAVDAVKAAAESPLLARSLKGARAIILNLTSDDSLSMYDVDEATSYITKQTSADVDLILGTVIKEEMNGEIQATLIATDFSDSVILKAPTVTVPKGKVKVKKESLPLDAPSFMRQGTKETPPEGGAFAIPAFRLTTDLPKKK